MPPQRGIQRGANGATRFRALLGPLLAHTVLTYATATSLAPVYSYTYLVEYEYSKRYLLSWLSLTTSNIVEVGRQDGEDCDEHKRRKNNSVSQSATSSLESRYYSLKYLEVVLYSRLESSVLECTVGRKY